MVLYLIFPSFFFFFIFHFHSIGTLVDIFWSYFRNSEEIEWKKNQQKHNKVYWAGWLNMKKNIIKMLSKAKCSSLKRDFYLHLLDESVSKTVTAQSTEIQIEKNLI